MYYETFKQKIRKVMKMNFQVGEAELAWIDAKVMKKATIGDRRGIDGEKEDEENPPEVG